MSARGEDELRIPIEIKTEDIAELREIIANLKEAQQDARSAVPTTRARADTGEARSAVRLGPFEERGGIFGGEAGGKRGIRDKTSAAPFQRESEFGKLRDQVNDLQDSQIEGLSAIDLIMGGAILRNSGAGALAGSGVKGAQSIVAGGTGAALGGLKSMAFRLVPHIAVALVAIGFIKTIIDVLIKPGGPFDRRFKRNIQGEISSATERERKAQIRQGLKIIRITPIAGFRGAGANIAGKEFVEGTPVYSQDFEQRGKGFP